MPPRTILHHSGPSELLPLVQSFVELSADTEFGFYKDPQWRFLLSGNEISAFIVPEDEEDEEQDALECAPRERINSKLKGCVLQVKLNEHTSGLGMVLVDPSQRGKGVARRLIDAAMSSRKVSITEDSSSNKDARHHDRLVLAVCSRLGQPVYRKIGFRDVGMVYALSCSLSDMRDAHSSIPADNPISTAWRNGGGGDICSKEGRRILNELDYKATGYDRRERLDLLLDGYAPESSATVVFGYDDRTQPCAAAVSRQDCPGGPIIVGPMIGPPEAALSLLWTLSRQHEVKVNESDDEIQMSIMISDHTEVVQQLLKVKGVTKAWEGPAMSMDGEPIYANGDGSYLALMHPTLG